MGVWIFQILLDTLLATGGVLWILSRRQVLLLEERIAILEKRGESILANKEAPSAPLKSSTGQSSHSRPSDTHSEPRVELQSAELPADQTASPVTRTHSTLQEKNLGAMRSSTASEKNVCDAYERAEQLLGRGMHPREVARTTGLSLAEIQLIGKVSNRAQ